MSLPEDEADLSGLAERLASLQDDRELSAALQALPSPQLRRVVDYLSDAVAQRIHVDTQQAGELADAAERLANLSGEPYCRARACRAKAHVTFSRGRHPEALDAYQLSIELFESVGDDFEVGRTLSSSLQLLIYMGRYEEAMEWGERARAIFAARGDRIRLARLESNVANLLYRQDRYREALARYEHALAEFQAVGEPRDVAIALRNIAVCNISLNRFVEALDAHRSARELCEKAGLHLLAVEADYNIAYLYYLRGQYTQAIELYRAARERCAALGVGYHEALCDLDQSELYLELNLVAEGVELAKQAFAGFERLGMGYEAAKALTNLAIGAGRQGEAFRSLELFERSREMFVREGNYIWPALIDAYRALVLHQEGRHFEARRFAEAALEFFDEAALASKAALCQLLLAHVHLQVGELRSARKRCLASIDRLARAEAPALEYRSHFLLGQIEETLAHRDAAFDAYREAHARLERMRSHLDQDELKIGFLKDKLVVYESLVWMTLAGERSRETLESAFGYIEQAKSRSLADLMAFRAQLLPARTAGGGSGLAVEVQSLREELNWYYRKIDMAELRGEETSAEQLELLREQSREREGQLLRTLRELQTNNQEFASLQDAATISLDEIRASLPDDSLMLEFYETRGTIVVAVLGRERLDIVPLTPSTRIRHVMRLLQFQFSKFRLGPDYVRTFGSALREAAEHHLQDLYKELLSPIRDLLDVRRLILVPHDFLHYVPFHALSYGGRPLVEDFSLCYAPSASVHHLCAIKPLGSGTESLVMGIPDDATPFIRDEVELVAATLPNSRLFVGEEADEARLRDHGPNSRYVHIATHGLFRYDNPMFSSLQLGRSRLSLFDLYQLELGADLVTLSGCGTGLNVVEGGDELIGLVRGILYAGARTALVTLWDVNDESTARFMERFYKRLQGGADKASALREAMLESREEDPHPYYWAPFVLVGRSE